MPQLRDFLSRFRPAGAPGAARAAVPADPVRRQEAELAPVLALLDAPRAACPEITAAARREARQLIDAAHRHAAAMAADAARRAAGIRQQSLDQALARARAEADARTAASARQADLTRDRARQRLPALTRRAVDIVWGLDEDRTTAGPAASSPGGAS